MPNSAAGTVGRVTIVSQNETGNGEAATYSVINVMRQAPKEIIIKPAAGARDYYPSARFINGEFRAQTFSDEALLYALAE